MHPAIAPLFACSGGEPPDCVLLGDGRDRLSYANLNRALELLMQGAPLIGIGRNRHFRESGRWMLDAGAFLQALGYGADCTAVVMASQVLRHWRSAIDRGGAHIICTMGDDVMIWLQGFVKQSTKTPPADLQVVHEIDAQAERWRMEVVNYH